MVATINAQCPACKTILDTAIGVQDISQKPNPNDITICAYCTSVLMFNKDLSLKEMSQDDIEKFKNKNPELFDHIEELRGKAVEYFGVAKA